MGVTNCLKTIPIHYFILLQLIIFVPLALVRDIAKLSGTALVADAFILAGLIIPITDSMREPHKFPAVLTGVMAFVTVLFGGAGALGYLTFGSKVETVILVNLNPESGVVQSVQFLYALAILLSIPLQFFPAVRIMENGLFTRSGKADPRVKWLKNAFRFGMVMDVQAEGSGYRTDYIWDGSVRLYYISDDKADPRACEWTTPIGLLRPPSALEPRFFRAKD
ncbi:hypothetical protein C0992_000633 [Termitomyces sp. T32_za158]|nr:hypothetical protein C0992_000633 [Termitomyces sp. T32_za158]